MTGVGDRFNRMIGRTRYVVCRVFLHLAGDEVAPLLGVLNQAARQAVDSEGDMQVLGEGLADICDRLLQLEPNWRSVANEGDVFWDEGEAGDYVTELFTDSAQRYLSEPLLDHPEPDPLSLPVTPNLIVMITFAYTGEVPELEMDLSNISDLKQGLKAIINLHYQTRLKAIQVHFSPARFGEQLTDDHLMEFFPELIPL